MLAEFTTTEQTVQVVSLIAATAQLFVIYQNKAKAIEEYSRTKTRFLIYAFSTVIIICVGLVFGGVFSDPFGRIVCLTVSGFLPIAAYIHVHKTFLQHQGISSGVLLFNMPIIAYAGLFWFHQPERFVFSIPSGCLLILQTTATSGFCWLSASVLRQQDWVVKTTKRNYYGLIFTTALIPILLAVATTNATVVLYVPLLTWFICWSTYTSANNAQKKNGKTDLFGVAQMENFGRFLRTINHDVNNLIGSILGNADLANSTSNPKKHLQSIQNLCLHFTPIHIDKIVKTAAYKNISITEPNQLVKKAISHVQRTLPKEILIEQDLGQLPLIRVKEEFLLQSLINILQNAVEATSSTGGKIHCKTKFEEKAVLSPEAIGKSLHGKSALSFTIYDHGKGIPKHLRHKIFEPFFSTKLEHMGIGLVQVLATVINHEGALEVSSNGGCTVTLWLPAPKEQDKTEQQYDVMVIDNDAMVVDTITELIETLDLRAIGFNETEKAIKALATYAIDSILLDVGSKDRNGMPTVEKLIQTAASKKIILMTGHLAKPENTRLVQKHNVQCLQKPIALQTLRHIFSLKQQPNE